MNEQPACKRCDLLFRGEEPYWLIQSNNTEGDQPKPWDPLMLYRVHGRCLQAGDSLVGSALEDTFWVERNAVGA